VPSIVTLQPAAKLRHLNFKCAYFDDIQISRSSFEYHRLIYLSIIYGVSGFITSAKSGGIIESLYFSVDVNRILLLRTMIIASAEVFNGQDLSTSLFRPCWPILSRSTCQPIVDLTLGLAVTVKLQCFVQNGQGELHPRISKFPKHCSRPQTPLPIFLYS
jgi:hypothetical protein